MRAFLFSLFFSALCAGYFLDPPHDAVASHNANLAPALLGQRLDLPGGGSMANPLKAFNLFAPVLFPAVDQNVSADAPPKAVWAWQYDFVRDFGWQGTLSGCDSSRSQTTWAGTDARFELRTNLDGVSRTVVNPPNPVTVPFSREELSAARGPLSVGMFGNLTLSYNTYTETKRCYTLCNRFGCRTFSYMEYRNELRYFSYPRTASAGTFYVERPALHGRLFAPLALERSVRQPWVKFYVFSNASVYRIHGDLDGFQTFDDQRLQFDVVQDALGRRRIMSVAAPRLATASDVAYQTDAVMLSNYSHGIGAHQDIASLRTIGTRNYSFSAVDVFGNRLAQSHHITTRDAANVGLILSTRSPALGQTVSAALSLSSFSGSRLSNRPVRLRAGTADLSANTDAGGRAVFAFVPQTPGTLLVTAVFPGDSEYPSAAATQALVVSAPPAPAPLRSAEVDGTLLLAVFMAGLLLSAGFA
ncbi:MAG: Ig-like domain-containing protein, partial [Candidatus Micrarchaeota archaeon]|nr:Ig-like domain-containing protein [Candidatus Micrarchaeota archaeon]